MIKYQFSKRALTLYGLYIAKCLLGAIICYSIYLYVPQYPFYWALVSVVIVIAPNNGRKPAYDRIKANFLGCVVGLALYLFHFNGIVLLCIGIILTIIIGILFQIKSNLRTALAALVIVIVQEEKDKDYFLAVKRVICVCAGCVVALIVTVLFSILLSKIKHLKSDPTLN